MLHKSLCVCENVRACVRVWTYRVLFALTHHRLHASPLLMLWHQRVLSNSPLLARNGMSPSQEIVISHSSYHTYLSLPPLLPSPFQSHFERAGISSSAPPTLFSFDELVMGKDGELRKEKRFPGTNKVGMLAWHTVLKTPQYPEGREVHHTAPSLSYTL